MKNTLLALSNGDLPSCSESNNSAEIEILLEYIERNSSAILAKLDGSEKKSLEKLKDCYNELLTLKCENSFVDGFSLASKIMVEALT